MQPISGSAMMMMMMMMSVEEGDANSIGEGEITSPEPLKTRLRMYRYDAAVTLKRL